MRRLLAKRWNWWRRRLVHVTVGATINHFTTACLLCLMVAGCSSGTTHGVRATATPSATPATLQGRLDALAHLAIGGMVGSVTTAYNEQSSVLTVTGTLTGAVARTPADIAATQERVKLLCFEAQRVLWTSGTPLRAVKVSILGPMYDDYFDLITDWYGVADLTSATAAKLDWARLSADNAWAVYDSAVVRQVYAPFQFWGGPTPTPTPGQP
ncbi:MAG TPA: hypothetical protein VKC57_01350 [Ktedonobacterales bacterium]|nr:hypothetical protein [Ktedonobacterales bacterium]